MVLSTSGKIEVTGGPEEEVLGMPEEVLRIPAEEVLGIEVLGIS